MATQKNEKEITLNSLAEIMNHRFDGIDKRFDGIDRKLDGLQKDFENLNEITSKSFDNLEAKVATKVELAELTEKVDIIDIRIDEIHEVTVGLEQGELQTGKSMRKLQRIISRLGKETR